MEDLLGLKDNDAQLSALLLPSRDTHRGAFLGAAPDSPWPTPVSANTDPGKLHAETKLAAIYLLLIITQGHY